MNNQLSFQEKYQAVQNRDTSYEVIFCRPGCTARTPKPESITFYNNINEAILNGFRPCKVCKPMESAEETPNYIINILRELNENPI